MNPPTETELKLDCDLSGLKTLQGHPRLKLAAKRRPVAKLRSVYFDTPDRRLWNAGLTLRVRKIRTRHVQTVKATGDGLFSRPEWECPVPGALPDRAALLGTPADALIDADTALEPVFTVEVDRRVFLVEEGGSQIEVALDSGRITTPDEAVAPLSLCEVELELKTGSASDVFALANTLGEQVPLRLGVLSKSERGFMLAEGGASGESRARAVKLDRAMTAAEVFRVVAHDCLRQIRLNEIVLTDTRHVEALHQMRVGVRRLRSAISLFGDLVDDAAGRALTAELKRLSEPYGRGRNLDVFLAEAMPQERERRPDEGGLLNLEKQLETDRAGAYVAIEQRVRSAEWARLLIDLAAWVNAGPWLSPADDAKAERLGQSARDFAAETLERRFRQVGKRGRGLDRLSAEERHRVRIAAKKLRYGAEFFGSLYDGEKKTERRRAFVKSLKRLQGHLGALNDIATGQEMMADAASTTLTGRSSLFAAGLMAGDLERGSGELVKQARKAYDALVDQRPFWR